MSIPLSKAKQIRDHAISLVIEPYPKYSLIYVWSPILPECYKSSIPTTLDKIIARGGGTIYIEGSETTTKLKDGEFDVTSYALRRNV